MVSSASLSFYSLFFICYFLFSVSCSNPTVPASYTDSKSLPDIYPDYVDVTIPINMAPLHFQLMSEADDVVTRFSGGGEEIVCGGRKAMPDADDWRQMADKCKDGKISVEVFAQNGGQWTRFKPFSIYVSPDSIDPWLSYRLISPSYITFEELTINQRCLENYDERIIYDNMLCSNEAEGQCINCHNYQRGNPNKMQFHARIAHGGTLINLDGKLIKTNLKTDSTISAGVYPAWHPTRNLIVYSTDKTQQVFHTRDLNKIEVFDSQSDLILYDADAGEVRIIENRPDEFEVFPHWSPDGKYLYYSSAHFEFCDTVSAETDVIMNYKDIKYNVYRKAFNEQTLTFGPRELVFDAAAKGLSATLPRVSPDGRFVLLSVGEWGCFHIWHRDADLWLVDLQDPIPLSDKGSNQPSNPVPQSDKRMAQASQPTHPVDGMTQATTRPISSADGVTQASTRASAAGKAAAQSPLITLNSKLYNARPFAEVNSPDVEAYHTWSTNGKWIVFSSRRQDGNYTRPFFAHVDKDGHATKPFELPCDDPDYHRQLMRSYNIPELMTGPVTVTPQQFADALKTEAIPAKLVTNK